MGRFWRPPATQSHTRVLPRPESALPSQDTSTTTTRQPHGVYFFSSTFQYASLTNFFQLSMRRSCAP